MKHELLKRQKLFLEMGAPIIPMVQSPRSERMVRI